DRFLVERVDLRRLGESARGDDVPGDRLDRRSLAAGEKDLGSLACKRTCDSTANATSSSVDHRHLVFENHLWLLSDPRRYRHQSRDELGGHQMLRKSSRICCGEADRGFASAPGRVAVASATSLNPSSGTPRSRSRSYPESRESSSQRAAGSLVPSAWAKRASSASAAGWLKRSAGARQSALAAPCSSP